jgi:hypothetical protein
MTAPDDPNPGGAEKRNPGSTDIETGANREAELRNL